MRGKRIMQLSLLSCHIVLPPRVWTLFVRAPGETPDDYRGRLKLVAAHINDHYDVDSLCRELPARVHALWQNKGDRITK